MVEPNDPEEPEPLEPVPDELAAEQLTESEEAQRHAYHQWLRQAHRSGYKPGWAIVQFKERYGTYSPAWATVYIQVEAEQVSIR